MLALASSITLRAIPKVEQWNTARACSSIRKRYIDQRSIRVWAKLKLLKYCAISSRRGGDRQPSSQAIDLGLKTKNSAARFIISTMRPDNWKKRVKSWNPVIME